MTRFRKNSLNPNLVRNFENSSADYFNFMMNNLHETVFDNMMSNYPEGPFPAICISGVASDNNTGTGTDPLDGFIGEDDKYLYLIVRPLINIGRILPDPLNYMGDKLRDF